MHFVEAFLFDRSVGFRLPAERSSYNRRSQLPPHGCPWRCPPRGYCVAVLCGGFVIPGSVDEQPHFNHLPLILQAGVSIASRMSTVLSTVGLLRSGFVWWLCHSPES